MCDTGIDTYYKLTPNKRRKDFRGIGLVIVNFFKNDPELKRKGAEEELQRLTKLFESFNLEVRPHTELTKDEIVKLLEDTTKDPNLSSDSMIAIAISTHGNENGLLGIHNGDRLVQENDPNDKNMDDCIPPTKIQEIFNGENCTGLVGKPKLFLLNGCRGNGIENIVQMEGKEKKEEFGHDGPKPTEALLATTWSDFFVIHSCVPGNISIRSSKVGSLFIIEFSEAYAKYGSKHPIESIMPTVNRNLITVCKTKDTPSKQSCTWESTCTRSLRIPPKDAVFESDISIQPTSKPPYEQSARSSEVRNVPNTKRALSNDPTSSSSEQVPGKFLPIDGEQFTTRSWTDEFSQQDVRNPSPYQGQQYVPNLAPYPGQQGFHNPMPYPGQQGFHNPMPYPGQQGFHNPMPYPGQQDFRYPTPYHGQQDVRNPTPHSSQQGFHNPPYYQGQQDVHNPIRYLSQQDIRNITPYSTQDDFHKNTFYTSQQNVVAQTPYSGQKDFHNLTPSNVPAFSRPKPPPMSSLSGLVVAKSGEIYVTDPTNESIWTFPNDVNAKVLEIPSNKFSLSNELAGLHGICIKGRFLFVTCNDRILKLSAELGELLQSESANTSLTGLDIDDVSHIYVCEQFTCSILVLDMFFNFVREKLHLSGINTRKARLLDIKVFPSEIYVLISGTDSAIQMFNKKDGILIMFIVSSEFLCESYFFTMDRDNKNIFAGDSATSELKAFNDEGRIIWKKNAFGENRESGTIMGIGMNSSNEVVIACICNSNCMIRKFSCLI